MIGDRLRQCAHLLRTLASVALLVHGACCYASNFALLIGISQYPALAPELQLAAPANDVRLMRQVLLQRGLKASHVDVLADGVPGAQLPTHAAIQQALASLRERVRPGDSVVFYFAGHGSVQPRPAPSEASAGQPILLPRDVRAWDGASGTAVPNAIPDVELRAALDDLNERGAFVFAVIDACHSARAVRGGAAGNEVLLRQRFIPPGDLDRPSVPVEGLPIWSTRSEPTASRPRAKAVYFYAAQSFELTPSEKLGADGWAGWHGLFSWHIAQALALGQSMSYRQLAQHVLSRYDQLPATQASPLFGGDGLDQAVFGGAERIVRQWPVDVVDGHLVVGAGVLSDLAEGALFALVADPLSPAQDDPLHPPPGTLGFARLTLLELQRASVTPVAWQQWPALPVQAVAKGVWARLMVNPLAFALRVAEDRSACRARCAGSDAIARLRQEGVPGVDVRWLDASSGADVVLAPSDLGVRLLRPGESAVDPRPWGYGMPDGDARQARERLASQVAGGLHDMARARNLLQLGARMALRPQRPDLELEVTVTRSSHEPVRASLDQLNRLAPGDRLTLSGRNRFTDPLDVAIFWIDSRLGIRQLYPLDRRDSPRLATNESLRRFALQVDADSTGTERLLVLTMPMRRGHEASDFRFLEQSPLSRTRGSSDPTLQALYDACFGDYRTRGSEGPQLPAEQLGMQVYTFELDP